MFEASFEHYLTYGATDQRTVRELQDSFTGLMVPGTVAAFQREGTGGFVLTLSATQAATPYVIDPRFPLFQKQLAEPKQSHLELASVFGDPSLVCPDRDPEPGDFTHERVDLIARSWVEFNQGYQTAANAKFDKYANRLNEPVITRASQVSAVRTRTVYDGLRTPMILGGKCLVCSMSAPATIWGTRAIVSAFWRPRIPLDSCD